jgi:hypothetical protein
MRIALIHALAHSVAPINDALARDWPAATRMNLLDDSLSADLAAGGKGLDDAMHKRFARLAQYAIDCGSKAILFTCSAFGPCIDAAARAHAPLPVLKPNEAMVAPVAVAQLVESQIVILVVVGSSPISHPIPAFHQVPCRTELPAKSTT